MREAFGLRHLGGEESTYAPAVGALLISVGGQGFGVYGLSPPV
jgi:hypothetical protein